MVRFHHHSTVMYLKPFHVFSFPLGFLKLTQPSPWLHELWGQAPQILKTQRQSRATCPSAASAHEVHGTNSGNTSS